ncbi:MAG: hypothetical protein CL670_08110 [Balneola sp.]|jgi:hypothetical protein|nr:hypothetical protein [Balneola sp.]MBE79101.1 hypothetical protein [Balneola sp.]|tara:strand:- start:40 stop:441 length:402 start_codon:yes stop_codon:yes gene_type:complete
MKDLKISTLTRDQILLISNYNSIKRELYKYTFKHFKIDRKSIRRYSFLEICELMETTSKLPYSLIRNLRCIHQINEEFLLEEHQSAYSLGGTTGFLVQEASDYVKPDNYGKSELLEILLKYVHSRLKKLNSNR